MSDEIIKPIVEAITDYIKDNVQKKEYIKNIQEQLSANYKSHSTVKNMLHSSGPVPFNDIFCPLSIKKLDRGSFYRDEPPFRVFSANDLMENYDNVAIFGNAGSGKSTLVNFLYLNAIENKYKYPVMISLRYLNEENNSLTNVLQSQILGKKNVADDVFYMLLKKGFFLFIFDGYDEITPQKQYTVSYEIKELMHQYPSNKYILTSRPLEQLYALNSFHNFTIMPLSNEERKMFIRKQFSKEVQYKAEVIINKLDKDENKQYSQLLTTPLLVILCILNFQYNPELPPKKSEFYSRIFDTLFQEHDWQNKTGFERNRKCKIRKNDYIRSLNAFSWITHFKSIYYFKKKEVEDYLNQILSKDIFLKRKQIDSQSLFYDFTVSINILIPDGVYYAFPHKSFQEYYVANYIVKKDETIRLKIYNEFITKILNGKGSLLTQPLLSMLYEMDKKLFLKQFIHPLLTRVKNECLDCKSIYFHQINVSKLLSIINDLFYGYDTYEAIRDIFSIRKRRDYVPEIEKLISCAENELTIAEDEDPFLADFFNDRDIW